MSMPTIQFTQNRDTLKYGKVKAGDRISVANQDAESFIAQGVAKRCGRSARKTTEEVTDHV